MCRCCNRLSIEIALLELISGHGMLLRAKLFVARVFAEQSGQCSLAVRLFGSVAVHPPFVVDLCRLL